LDASLGRLSLTRPHEEWDAPLQEAATDKLAAVAVQIEQAVTAVTAVDFDQTNLSPEQARDLARRIRSLQQRVQRNQELWLQVLERIRTAAEQLQVFRRYAACLATQSASGRRYSRSV
jgi:hypothetical protein